MVNGLYHNMGMRRTGLLFAAGILSSLLLIACGGPADDQAADDSAFEAVAADEGSDVAVAADMETTPVADAQTLDWPEDAPEGFFEALEMGLVVNGYNDVEGLQRVMAYYFDNVGNPAADVMFDPETIGGLDLAPEDLAALESLVRGIDIEIYRVGFVPNTGNETEMDSAFNDVFGGVFGDPSGGGSEDPLGNFYGTGGSVASGLSLVSSVTGTDISPSSHGAEVTISYSDGSTFYQTRTYHSDGSASYVNTVTDADGNIIYWDEIEKDENDTVVSTERTEVDPSKTSEADQDYQRATGGDGGAGDDGDTTGLPPADESGEGGFCFLFVAPCYNAFLELQSGASGAGLGYVLINPGRADEEPEAAYLSIDPQDLVINPSGEVAGSASGTNRIARFALPVIVLPPRP